MRFCFYPKHEYACPHVSHCPHLGGAALATLVLAAGDKSQYMDMLHGQLAAEREATTRLLAEVESLKQELAEAKLELRLERQSKFMTARQKRESDGEAEAATAEEPTDHPPRDPEKKRGAPVGHPGWFRAMPTSFDRTVDVSVPDKCPHCGGDVACYASAKATEHLQEDVVDGMYQVVLYRHPVARCRRCRRWVQQAGEGELLGSRIGPKLRALALFLRNDIGVSYRKVPRTMQELFDFPFTPAALIGFEKGAAEASGVVSDDIAQKIASSDGAVHADETYWSLDVRQFVKRGCAFHRDRAAGKLSPEEQAAEATWLRAELARLESCAVDHPKAVTLQQRIVKHQGEWLVFLDDPRVPPTNNLAERALRPLVVLRKITFGHRTAAGAQRMAQLMSVQETAKRHGHKASEVFYRLLTQPPNRVLRYLYAGSKH